MALNALITFQEILDRMPEDLIPDDLTQLKVEQIRDQLCGWLEDVFGVFDAATARVNTAKLVAINYSAVLCVVYAGSVPDMNFTLSPVGELKLSPATLPKAIASFVVATLDINKLSLQTLSAGSSIPTTNSAVQEGFG